ncbi:response regulator [Massilia sp. TS11]|uniref:response regulator n=1 Tax=Massilia sp. TS11 TaxID=2908003 RepID=UPI001EDBEFD5|nr:response regulator [Massilia sp. TS11]MCG2582926.1 response regulator [Massilia sp. TS11]
MPATKSILVVDDSRVSRLLIRQCILSKSPSITVEEAANGEEAIQKVGVRLPDLVFMDVNMPGMGGLAAAEQLRASYPQLPIAMITANVQNATRQRATELGLSFVEKPINEQRIHELLDTMEA